MNWIFYALLANLAILLLEYIYRMRIFDGFWVGLPYTITPILLAQIALFYLFKEAPTWILGAAVFTSITVILRVVLSTANGEPLNWKIGLGVGLMTVAVLLVRMK